ncbi:MAG TPA: DUF1501 domain-containing protein [Burkholderiales bacterium]|nr:DUF1501 domain-containing protein [Burkholderiales bacterium]
MVIIMRGGMDGLGAVVPYGDPDYADARGPIALPQNADTLADLDGHFAFNRALDPLLPLYRNQQLLVLHAAATPYRERSHFDAQDLLESGGLHPHALSTGWLNRAVAALQRPEEALALGPTVPLVLRGSAPVTSWAPSVLPGVDEDFLGRVAHMYEKDALLSHALEQSRMLEGMGAADDGGGHQAFPGMMKKAAELLSAPSGPRIASVDVTGWDTHANQNGRLAGALKTFAQGITAFRDGVGPLWDQTVVIAATEFGRTVRGNGTGGTDHGTASAAFMLGGRVAGGRVAGDWPGLSRLRDGRDLLPANDLRSLFKAALDEHLGLREDVLAATVFPDSAGVKSLRGVISV